MQTSVSLVRAAVACKAILVACEAIVRKSYTLEPTESTRVIVEPTEPVKNVNKTPKTSFPHATSTPRVLTLPG